MSWKPMVGVLGALVTVAVLSGEAAAQSAPGTAFAAQRDCQTVRTCQYKRGGSYRGCVSSYSCRRCRFVPAACTIAGARGTCSRIRCEWAG